MFSGYRIDIEINGQTIAEQFVIPAILEDAVAAMVATIQAQDPQDEFTVRVRWDEQATRPLYAVAPEYRYEPGVTWPTDNAAHAFAEVWSK